LKAITAGFRRCEVIDTLQPFDLNRPVNESQCWIEAGARREERVRADALVWTGYMPRAVQTAVAGVISAVGSEHMDQALAEGLNLLARTDRIYAFAHEMHRQPRQNDLYAAWARSGNTDEMTREYAAQYYKNDPINDVMRRASSGSMFASFRLTREEIPDCAYRRLYFDEPEVCERITLLTRTGMGWRGLSLSRTYRSGYFRRDEIERVAAFSEVALPLLARHRELVEANQPPMSDTFALEELEARFERRFPELTGRERQVCARTIIGMTAEAISIDLCIGQSSVQTYRRRAYKRLDICSAYQLAPLILS
jgi:DNA-binding CsgD family transcriptional regulator